MTQGGQTVTYAVFEQATLATLAGLLGALIYAVTYVMVAFDRMPSQTANFYLTRMIAAALVGISLLDTFHLATAVIQGFFLVVSAIGLIRHRGARREALAYLRSQEAADLGDRLTKATSGRRRMRQEPAQSLALRVPE